VAAQKIIEIEETMEKGLFQRLSEEFGFIRGNLLLILSGWLLTDFSREMAFTYYPLYVQALGGSASTVGLIGAASSITSALMQFPGGYLADRYGRKRIISTMTLLAAFAYLFYAFAPNWQAILLGAILCEIWGYSIINLITNASTTPSPLIAGVLYTKFGLVSGTRMSFLVVTLAFIVSGLLRTRLKETLENPEPIKGRELLRSFSDAKIFVEGINAWGKVPRTALALLLIELMFIIPNVMFNVTLIFYLTEVLGFNHMEIAFIGSVISISIIVLAIPCGKLVDRIGKKKPMLIGCVLIAVAMPLIIWGNFIRALVVAPIIALVNILFGTSTQALNADLIPPEHRGKILGSRSFFLLIASSAGSILGGFIYDNVSRTLPMYTIWAATVPFFFLTLFFIKEPKKEEINGV